MLFGDVQRLRAFELIVDLGSISAAAQVLGYTQSAVSQQLAALEREVGETLVERSQRPLRPTPAGEELRPHVARILAELAGAEEALAQRHEKTRRLRLAAFASALSSFVPPAVRDLRRAHPDVVVRILQLETKEAVESVRRGDADLAVVHHLPGVAVPETAGLERHPLMLDRLYAVVPSGHRLARRSEVAIGDLEQEPLGLPRRDTPAGRFRSLVEHLCAEAGFAPRVAYELDDLAAAQAFMAAGISVGLMHGLTLATAPPGVTILPLTEPSAGARAVEAVSLAGARTPAIRELLEGIAKAAQAYQHRDPPLRPSWRNVGRASTGAPTDANLLRLPQPGGNRA